MKNYNKMVSIETELNKINGVYADFQPQNEQLVVKNNSEYTALVSNHFILHNAKDLFTFCHDEVNGNVVRSYYDCN